MALCSLLYSTHRFFSKNSFPFETDADQKHAREVQELLDTLPDSIFNQFSKEEAEIKEDELQATLAFITNNRLRLETEIAKEETRLEFLK